MSFIEKMFGGSQEERERAAKKLEDTNKELEEAMKAHEVTLNRLRNLPEEIARDKEKERENK